MKSSSEKPASINGGCNKLHSLEQQLARWLLTMNDYVGDELRLTHDLMALTLGVRRAGVSVAANTFRNSGAIDYRRAAIFKSLIAKAWKQ